MRLGIVDEIIQSTKPTRHKPTKRAYNITDKELEEGMLCHVDKKVRQKKKNRHIIKIEKIDEQLANHLIFSINDY